MLMYVSETELLKAALDEALSEGKSWVAFNDQADKELHPNLLHYFTSAGEAEKFCNDNNAEWDFVEQMFNWDNYIYISIKTLKLSVGIHLDGQIDIVGVARDMAAQNLHLPEGRHMDDLEDSLAAGLHFPVYRRYEIEPLKEIADYSVIAHRHDGGQVYEIGHSIRVMQTFGSYKDARTFLDSAVLYNELSDKGIDYVLVGRFHNQRLELDMEGYAMPHSGLTMVCAADNYDLGHDYHELNSLFEKATLSQYFFAGIKDGKLALFNDKLELTVIGQSQQPFYIHHYNHDYLTTKNHTTMNQKSFDYNKDMLMNLGFGDEIAKDLLTKMDQNLTEFTLDHRREFGKDVMESVLYFSKGDQESKDITFFNKFDTTLKKEGMEDLTQTFFVGQKYNYTLQERYNMMDGRFVYRQQPKMEPKEQPGGEVKMKPTGETYYAWRGLDFKNADGYGNFDPKIYFWDHKKDLQQYPIKGIEENYNLDRIRRPLEKGNKADVVLLRAGQETMAKVVANPRMTRLEFTDANGQTLLVRKVEKQAVDQTQKSEMTPQEVQRAAMAKAAAAKDQNQTPEQRQTPQTEQNNTQQLMQKESAEQRAASEQKQDQGQRRRQGVRVS